jgi:sigma-B regulation protein RsbU (phosphoserine phosphatase)
MLMLGDVTGKGVDAAALTALTRHTAWEASQADNSPAHVLARVDAALKHRGAFAICTALCVRLEGSQATIAVGGHPLPLLVREGNVEPAGQTGGLLGALHKVRWPETVVSLEVGEMLLAFTDGVTDTMGNDKERFGEERLTGQLVRADSLSATSVCRAIADSLAEFQQGEQSDDIAIVALRFLGAQAGAMTETASPRPQVLEDEANKQVSFSGAHPQEA